jgi:hypothetical protein
MECWAMDIIGPLPPTEKGNRFILTMCDAFTRWTEAVALPDQTAESVAKAVVDHIIAVHGVPESILTDQGRNFESSLMAELATLMGIKKLRTTAYHPEGNGMCERINGSLCEILASLVNIDGNNWDVLLNPALGIFRSKRNRMTGFSPFELTFGRPPKCVPDLQIASSMSQSPYMTHHEYASYLRQNLAKLHESVVDKQVQCALNSPEIEDTDPIDTGEEVYIHRHQRRHKFAERFDGPYEVVRPVDAQNVEVRNSKGGTTTVHTQRIKRVPSRARRTPQRYGNLLVGHAYERALHGGRNVANY